MSDERLAGRKLYLESIAIVPLARDVSGEISIITELLVLRARNAKLEAALAKAKPYVARYEEHYGSNMALDVLTDIAALDPPQ